MGVVASSVVEIRAWRAIWGRRARRLRLCISTFNATNRRIHDSYTMSIDVDMLQRSPTSRSTPKDSPPETNYTLRHPPYVYIYLTIQTLSPNPTIVALDKVTARSYLHSALSQFLGLTGAAIQLDLLEVEGRDIWLRVAKDDASAVVAAVSQWMGARQDVSLRVKARGTWLGAVVARGARDERLWTMEK